MAVFPPPAVFGGICHTHNNIQSPPGNVSGCILCHKFCLRGILPQDLRGKVLPLTKFLLTVEPPPSCTFVLHLPGAGQVAREAAIFVARTPPGVVGTVMMFVVPSFLYQSALLLFPPLLFICSSLSCLLLNISLVPWLWFDKLLMYFPTSLLNTMSTIFTTQTVPSTKFLQDGKVPPTNFLLDGTVPSRYFLLDGIVPSMYSLWDSTVPSTNRYLKKI